jgi:ribonuclease I
MQSGTLAVVACVIAYAGGVIAQSGNDPYGKAGDYDLLIFARFWMGEPANQIACGSFAASNLTLHGIWPQYLAARETNHLWPQFCNSSSAVTQVSAAVQSKMLPDWQQYARSYPDDSSLQYKGLAGHEWERHGVCWSSAVNSLADAPAVEALQLKFFNSSINLMRKFPTPALLGDSLRAKKPIALAALQAAFGGAQYVALQCGASGENGQAQLTMVSLCFDKDLIKQIACPDSALQEAYLNSCVVPTPVAEVTVAFNCTK